MVLQLKVFAECTHIAVEILVKHVHSSRIPTRRQRHNYGRSADRDGTIIAKETFDSPLVKAARALPSSTCPAREARLACKHARNAGVARQELASTALTARRE